MGNGSINNIIHVMVSDDYKNLFLELMKSLNKYSSPFKLHFVELGNAPCYEIFSGEKEKVVYEDWQGRRAQIRLKSYLDFDYREGDRIISMDTDMLVMEDPFKMFDIFKGGDVFLSTRDHKDKIPVTACFLGFIWNERTRSFLKFIKNQVEEKLNWHVLREFRRRRQHIGMDWWIDQDVLCALYMEGYKDLRVRDIGWHWSYDNNYKLNVKSWEGKIKRESAKVIHYKNSKKWRNTR